MSDEAQGIFGRWQWRTPWCPSTSISSFRPYRQSLGADTTMAELRKERGILFDSEIVDICLDLYLELTGKLSGNWLL